MSKAVHVDIKQDCFHSLMDKTVLLQIVAFIEIYEHSRMDTHTDSWRDGWAWPWKKQGVGV